MNFPIIYLTISLIVSLIIFIYAWRHPQARGSKEFAITTLFSVIWVFGDIISRFNPTFEGQWLAECIKYFGAVSLPVGLLVFVFRYCQKHISSKTIKILSIVPAISWLVMITNPLHHYFFNEVIVGYPGPPETIYGVYFWTVHLPYSYFLVSISFITVLFEISRASRHYRSQIIILFISLCIPLIVNIIGVFRLLGSGSFTPLSFPIFFTLMAFAIYRFQFLESNPIAYETVFQTIRDGVIVLDQNNIIRDINPMAARSLGRAPQDIVGLPFSKAFEKWKDIITKYEDKLDFYEEVEVEMNSKKRFLSVTITPIKNGKSSIDGRIFTIRDITNRREHQKSLETLAFHDSLTRLANRRKFMEEARKTLETSKKKNEPFSILYFDLNRFKQVNDTMGHKVGDELLKYVAARVASTLRKPDLLARIGGDEFAVLLHKCDEEGIELIVDRILENVQKPFIVKKHKLVADLSIGAAIYPEHGKTLGQLLTHADKAMYEAKSGGVGLIIYDKEPKSANAIKV